MSYSSDVKIELSKVSCTDCCEVALLYGMLLCGRSFGLEGIGICTKHYAVAELYSSLLYKLCNVECEFDTTESGRYVVKIKSRISRQKVLDFFGHGNNRTDKINLKNIQNECCRIAFVRGAFLVSGTITDPEKGYHFEIAVISDSIADSLKNLMELSVVQDTLDGEVDVTLSPKRGTRNHMPFVYFKDSSSIETILTLFGAPVSAMRIMTAKVEKDINNNITRKNNLDIANIDRMIDASLKYTQAVELLQSKNLLSQLRADVCEVALMKYENPEMSLNELADAFGISRSAVNYRLGILISEAEKIRK